MYLDPDYRKDPPFDIVGGRRVSRPHCARCQKEIKDVSKAVRVTVNPDTWDVTLGGDELLGSDCFKTIKNA